METLSLSTLLLMLKEALDRQMRDAAVLVLLEDESVVTIAEVGYDEEMRCYVIREAREDPAPEGAPRPPLVN